MANSIIDELGREIRIGYTQPLPCNTTPSTAYDNHRSCFPRWWAPPEDSGGHCGTVPSCWSWWNKYVTDSVRVRDLSGLSPTMRYSYEYPGGEMFWHSDDNPHVRTTRRSHAEYRGFRRVKVTTGAGSDPNRSTSTHTFFTGLHNDITSHSNPNTSPRKSFQLDSAWLGEINDHEWLAKS